MIPNTEGRGITSKHNAVFIVSIAFIPLEQKSNLNLIKTFNQYWKSDRTQFIIFVYLESLIKRIDACNYNSEKLSTTKVGEHIPCRYSMSMIWPFDGIENNHNVNGGQDCIKKFFEFLRADAMKKINFEKKKMIPLTNKQQDFNEKTKICNMC